MAGKLFPCLICLLFVVVLFSPESEAFANGAGAGKPGKRTFIEKNDFHVSINAMAFAYRLLPLIVWYTPCWIGFY